MCYTMKQVGNMRSRRDIRSVYDRNDLLADISGVTSFVGDVWLLLIDWLIN